MLQRGTAIDRSKDFIVRSSRGKEISTLYVSLTIFSSKSPAAVRTCSNREARLSAHTDE